MMRLGIDFGTTRIVVAAVDRGNYPVVSFESPDGETRDWFPPLIAATGSALLYGWDAWAAQDAAGATVVRSIKRYLHEAGPETPVEIGDRVITMLDVLTALASSLKRAIVESSSVRPRGAPEVMLGVPANADGNQRFLTAEAFRRAGFEVMGLLNEPAAASIEHSHGARGGVGGGNRSILVYDLGGGTFDASLVEIDGASHIVAASEGISTMGGDDFDGVLADLALEAARRPVSQEDLTQSESFRLHEECRQKKESLHPNTRRIVVDLESVRVNWEPVTVTAADFYERCRPLVEETIHATNDLLAAAGIEVHTLYVTGGGSELPLVSRMLRETFGRRVRRSAYSRSATGIGLAIQADAQASYQLRDRFTRYFGVWREAESGRVKAFDPFFLKGTPLPAAGQPPLAVARTYSPAHNIGHFRYLECSHLGDGGRPAGEITLWDEILFPFDPALRDASDLAGVTIAHSPAAAAQQIEESCECDTGGGVTVTIANRAAGYSRSYRLGRWALRGAPVVPGRRKKTATRGQ
ncbi:MAG: Hsp70 family protein [Bryobacteraceae bacterium]